MTNIPICSLDFRRQHKLICSFLRFILHFCVLPKKFIAKCGYLTYYPVCMYCIVIEDWWHVSNTSICAGEQEGVCRCQFAQSKYSVSRRFASEVNSTNPPVFVLSFLSGILLGLFLNRYSQERGQQSWQWIWCTIHLTLQTWSSVQM